MKLRVLSLTLEDTIEIFIINKWKFYSIEDGMITVEVPRGYTESYLVEFPFQNDTQKNELVKKLLANGFIHQEIRTKGNF